MDGHIDKTAATLSLADCCIWYLCKPHHDIWIPDDQFTENIISGDYRLHSYAAAMCLALVERYVSLNGPKPLSGKLIRALDCLTTERFSSEFTASTELIDQWKNPNLEKFKDEWPKIHALLSNMVQFQRRCSNFEYRLSKGEMIKPWQPIFSLKSIS